MSDEHEHAFRLEEYRHISAAIIDLDGRIMTVFGLSLAAAGTLLGVTAPAVFGEAGPAGHTAPLALACWSLAPALLVAAALKVQVNLRRDIIRLGLYRKVFFEEDGVRGLRWESALERFRRTFRGETNDPIPMAYWLIALASVTLSWSATRRAGVGALAWAIVLSVTVAVPALLKRLHAEWLDVIRSDLPVIAEEWKPVKADLQHSV
ncbi:MAG: hypothetical protein HY271_19200 [Deltaproteobacteria bacterium]|nr:hypothetical protein [Deltaproteobacteria bacterium]